MWRAAGPCERSGSRRTPFHFATPLPHASLTQGGDTVRLIRKNTGANVSVMPATKRGQLRVVLIESTAG